MIQLIAILPITAVVLTVIFFGYLSLKMNSEKMIQQKLNSRGTYSHTLQNLIHKVQNFNSCFGFQISNKPSLLKTDDFVLCFKLMEEENTEYLEACKNKDMIEIADALGDQLFVLLGTIIKHGLQDKIEDVFDEIYLSNMSKLDKNGKPLKDTNGKAIKSNQYFKPNLEKFFI